MSMSNADQRPLSNKSSVRIAPSVTIDLGMSQEETARLNRINNAISKQKTNWNRQNL